MRSLLLFLLLLCAGAGFAQLDESLKRKINEHVPNCDDIATNSMVLIHQFYLGGDMDSVWAILNYWEDQCGTSQEIYFAKVLIEIEQGSFDTSHYQSPLSLLTEYRFFRNYLSNLQTFGSTYYVKMWEARINYLHFLEGYAKRLMQQGSVSDSLQRGVLEFYAGNYQPMFQNLKNKQYSGKLQKEYNATLQSLIYDSGIVTPFSLGLWVPTGKLATLGNHPEIGFGIGWYSGKFGAFFDLTARFGKSPVMYSIREADSVYTDDHFTGVTAGVQGYYSLFKNLRHDLNLSVGLAYDEIMLVPAVDEDESSVFVKSLNANVGLQYRYYFDYKDYLGVDIRYNILDFRNNIDDAMDGNAFTLRLIYGWTLNDQKKKKLQSLGY